MRTAGRSICTSTHMDEACEVCGKPGWIAAGLCQSCRMFLFLTEKDVRDIGERIQKERKEREVG